MKRISLILVVFAVSCIILSQGGCRGAEKSAPAVQKPAPVVPASAAVEQKAPAVVAPRPVPDKPAPATDTPKPAADEQVRAAKEPVAKPDDGKGPRIKFDELIHNFGDIAPGSRNNCEFQFKNVGNALLKIIDITADCGCTVPTSDKREYAPGEAGTAKVEYHAAAVASLATKHVYVTTNDTVNPKVTLTLKARIVDRVSYEPRALKLLLKGGDDKLPKVTLTSLDGKPFKIKGVKSSANSISAQFDPEVEATKFVLELKVDKAQLRKVTNGVVEFSLTHPDARSISIPFTALTQFTLNPPTVIVFDAEPGKPIIRDVTILNNYQENFETASVKSKTGITEVAEQEKINYGHRFSLRITPPDAPPGTQRFSDVVTITVKGGESLTINCQGFYKRKK